MRARGAAKISLLVFGKYLFLAQYLLTNMKLFVSLIEIIQSQELFVLDWCLFHERHTRFGRFHTNKRDESTL